jgi:hypothetical protein
VEFFARRPDVDFCYGSNVYVDEFDRVLYLRSAPPLFWGALLRVWNYLHQPAVFFRSGVLERLRLNVGLRYIMDYDFWLRAAREFRFARLPGILAASRWHRTSKTMLGAEASFEELERLQKEMGKPWLARLVPPRHTARALYNLQRVLSALNLRQLRCQPRFGNIRVAGIGPLLRRQLLGLRLSGACRPSPAAAEAGG